jgi:hypothetical protein
MHEECFPINLWKPRWTSITTNSEWIISWSCLPGIHRQFFEKSFFVDGLVKKWKMLKSRSLDEDFDGHLVYLED